MSRYILDRLIVASLWRVQPRNRTVEYSIVAEQTVWRLVTYRDKERTSNVWNERLTMWYLLWQTGLHVQTSLRRRILQTDVKTLASIFIAILIILEMSHEQRRDWLLTSSI